MIARTGRGKDDPCSILLDREHNIPSGPFFPHFDRPLTCRIWQGQLAIS